MGLALRAEEDQTRPWSMPKRKTEAERRVRRERLDEPKMKELGALLRQLADERCGPNADFEDRSRAARDVFEFLAAGHVDTFTDGKEREDPED
jgi:hypothetical protein